MTRRGGGVSSPFAAPCDDARQADVFWCAELCPSVLPARASPADDPHACESFSLSGLTCRVVALVAPDGPVYVLFRDGPRSLQLTVSDGELLERACALTFRIDSFRHLEAQMRALRAIKRLHDTGLLDARDFPAEPRGRRLRMVLQALDGWAAHAPYREIALALFGQKAVDADWRDPRDYLRDRVRRAIRRGRMLMDTGYRSFLR